MSSKAVSYYDWSLSFKKNIYNHNPTGKIEKKENPNSIGLYNSEFKKYLKNWKENNLT